MGAGVIAAAGAVTAAVVFWPFSAGPSQASRTEVPAGFPAALDHGRVLALTANGDLVLSDPAATHAAKLTAIGKVAQETAASLDGRFLSLGNGQVLTVRRDGALAAYPAKVPLSSIALPAWPDPFSDHDRDLVILPKGGFGSSAENPVTVVSVASGTPRALGVADAVAADPAAAGAIVSVAAPQHASSGVEQVSPDSRVELRDVGRPAVVLATAAELCHDLGVGPGTPVAFELFPNLSGNEIAVEVFPVAGNSAGIVVLNRTGRVLGNIVTPFGVQGVPAWSPSGTVLAYPSIGNDGPGLFIWSGSGQPIERPIPPSAASGSFFGRCVWSSDATAVLCETGVQGQQRWLIVGAQGGAVTVPARAPGVPLLWLSGGGR